MTIRAATHQDIPEIVSLFLRLKRVSDYAMIPHDTERSKATIRKCISSPQAYAKVALSKSGEIVGCLLGVVDSLWWSKLRYASDIGFFSQVPGAGSDLVDDLEAWAWRQNGVVEVLLAQSSGVDVDRTDHWYQSKGYARVGGVFRKTRYEAFGQESAA
jgi:hypothetical protein